MMPEMKLETNAFLVEDIMLPKFYSVQFELYMDEPEIDDGTTKLILGLTDDLGNVGAAGYGDLSFGIEKPRLYELNFVTEIMYGAQQKHSTPITSEWYGKWLSFKIIRYLLVCMVPDLRNHV